MGFFIEIIVALLPPLLLLSYVYINDSGVREPLGYLIMIFSLGAICAIPAYVIENRLLLLPIAENKYIKYFFIVAFTEELIKFFGSFLITFNRKTFDHTYDALVYVSFASMGFAFSENAYYIVNNGLKVGIIRAYTAIPLHFITALVLGIFYSLVRVKKCKGKYMTMFGLLVSGILLAVTIHGTYDFLVSDITAFKNPLLISMGIALFMYLLSPLIIKIASIKDRRIDGRPEGYMANVVSKRIYNMEINDVINMPHVMADYRSEEVKGNTEVLLSREMLKKDEQERMYHDYLHQLAKNPGGKR